MSTPRKSPKPIRSILVANRSEISIRVMRAAAEMGIRTVAIHSAEDRFALHRSKADESYRVGEGGKPVAAYLDIDDIIRIAREAGVEGIGESIPPRCLNGLPARRNGVLEPDPKRA